MWKMALVVSAVVLVAGCVRTTPKASEPKGFVQGRAKVLEVNNELGMAVLEFKGKRTPAYWDTEIVTPFHVSGVDSHQTTPQRTQDLANSKDAIHPVEEQVTLPAKPGDTVVFRAMRTGDELFLRSVQVVPN